MPQNPTVPAVTSDGSPLVTVQGTFFRAVDPAYRESALAGSRSATRYAPANMPTLYLSASRSGVAAALIKHGGDRAAELEVLTFTVTAQRIADLRDVAAMRRLGVDPKDAAGDWQRETAETGTARSWRVRRALERIGATGLIDPSCKAPGLWHLALFEWNVEGAPTVQLATP
ncbi:hypothetical protein BKD30_09770 [Tersicoccus phoenicis]|uniref:RES domain-containing protein n=1 Tax=Tersicoccus phoenicis TaxID=554083 RepID=A0A1R1L9F4_9MICC|nr:RES domain-containing protein [Tersicoccus phoenicis]OMH24165.1 hypothetical protein BKD30_09770 [Tersicoccus phoenicis]